MAIEIERKFLVRNDSWKSLSHKQSVLKQGYLGMGAERSVRVRLSEESKAYLNIKSSTNGISRIEFDYEIPLEDANIILEKIALKPVIEKTRYLVKFGNHIWEIDEFSGDNRGLIVAEIELSSENESFERPDWLGEEVSSQSCYYNMNIASGKWREHYPEDLLLKFGG